MQGGRAGGGGTDDDIGDSRGIGAMIDVLPDAGGNALAVHTVFRDRMDVSVMTTEVCSCESRLDDDHAHTEIADLVIERFGVALHGMLRRGVDAHERSRQKTED